jgi:Subtilase family
LGLAGDTLPHLRLVRAEPRGTRHARGAGFGSSIHGDRQAHGNQLQQRAQALAAVHVERRATLGVDPKLVLVFELGGSVSASALQAAGLTPLGGTQGTAVVAFADDPQLHAFLERLRAYTSAGAEAKYAPNEGFVDVLNEVRAYGPADRLTPRLKQRQSETPDGELDVQLDLWHPGDTQLAEAWIRETADAVTTARGTVVDVYINHRSGLLLIRAHIPASAVDELSQIDEIALIDGVPRLPASRARARQASIEELPEVPAARADAPLVGMIDSGVRSAHPMLAPAIQDAATLSEEFEDGEDENGHGTRVAGLLLHGQLEDALERGLLPRPFCRLLSVRVLGPDNLFPAGSVWEAEIERAIRYCAAQGVKVVNLSIGDDDTIYRGAQSTPVAALIDQLARELKIVIVVPTGNVQPAVYLDPSNDDIDAYVDALLESPDTQMLDPAPATSALTVGALAPDALAGTARSSSPATRRVLGNDGWPAPFSRRGPGIDAAVKPELSATGGSIAIDVEFGQFIDDDALGVLSTSGGIVERLLDVDIGTSFAVPLVARVAVAVVDRYPAFSANLVRALTLLSAAEPPFAQALAQLTPAKREKIQLQTVGYGEPRLTDAIGSTPHRTILIADDEIPVDTTIVYDIPIPSSFGASGGAGGIDIALAFDPETRARRLDYAATKMEFWLVRGMSAEEITDVFTKTELEELETLEAAEEPESDERERVTPSKLGRNLLRLSPSGRVRSRGANQLGRIRFGQRLRNEDGDTYHLVVQCRQVWPSAAPAGFRQSFGLAVTLWRDEDRPPIYEELRARAQVAVEVPVEIEVRR